MVLKYQALSLDRMPLVPSGFVATNTQFGLSLSKDDHAIAGPDPFRRPITVTFGLSRADIDPARGESQTW